MLRFLSLFGYKKCPLRSEGLTNKKSCTNHVLSYLYTADLNGFLKVHNHIYRTLECAPRSVTSRMAGTVCVYIYVYIKKAKLNWTDQKKKLTNL